LSQQHHPKAASSFAHSAPPTSEDEYNIDLAKDAWLFFVFIF
jgi:hypothetical protein